MTSRTATSESGDTRRPTSLKSDAISGWPPRPTVSLIIPTRNEAGNINELVARIERASDGIAIEIIFVDDSTDDTPNVISDVSRHCRLPVSLIHRPPGSRSNGLAGAVTEGTRAATGDWICVMDADLQHPPELIPKLVARAEYRECDIVIASRYLPGGSARGLGTPMRKLISLASKWLAKAVFPERLWSVSDPCAGFFIVRGRLLEHTELRPAGFKILLEILIRAAWRRVEEIPYEFEGRGGGQSKATVAQGRAFVKHLARLWAEVPGAGRFSKFALVGASGVAVNLGLLSILVVWMGLNRWLGWALALEASIVWNFFLNRSLTWADRPIAHGRSLAGGLAAYHAVSCTSLAANAGVFASLILLSDAPVILAGFIAIVAGILINFVGANTFVFRVPVSQNLLGVQGVSMTHKEAKRGRLSPSPPLSSSQVARLVPEHEGRDGSKFRDG